jgi:predicted DNA-binding transcriptional regulator AlpA
VADEDPVVPLLEALARLMDELASRLKRSSGSVCDGRSPSDSAGPTRDPEPYIDVEEVATRLGYSPRWVRERVRADGLPSRQRVRNARHRFLWSEVAAWYEREVSGGESPREPAV